MGLNKYSDYGSGSSSESSSPWCLQDTWEEFHSRLRDHDFLRPRSSSFTELDVKSKLEARMQEFKMNGFDSPYDPDEKPQTTMLGVGPSYLRQKSWPAPEVTPTQALPRVDWTPLPQPIEVPAVDLPKDPVSESWETITEDQMKVLKTLPSGVLYGLLKQIEQHREVYVNQNKQHQMECRFCKNNGERAPFYRSHSLRARGRVTCPVLRAFVCRRCGAHGDNAHTLKYCPLATADERKQSTAIMHSVRMASGKRRQPAPFDLIDDYMVLRPTPPQVPQEPNSVPQNYAPLDPIWEALERKLML
ncbi:uncharacterized protein LOC121729385 isoform X3 [Aricia agestis]|uniref:uncharacterized protein LOC121729385 isoform X3 n=1 Tax=Aricia agestis TaxID=91739 RepID=UPI001C20991B|nr:uncharacterized protein LOC121729385 isoform X3 [Aricia agestis]